MSSFSIHLIGTNNSREHLARALAFALLDRQIDVHLVPSKKGVEVLCVDDDSIPDSEIRIRIIDDKVNMIMLCNAVDMPISQILKQLEEKGLLCAR